MKKAIYEYILRTYGEEALRTTLALDLRSEIEAVWEYCQRAFDRVMEEKEKAARE